MQLDGPWYPTSDYYVTMAYGFQGQARSTTYSVADIGTWYSYLQGVSVILSIVYVMYTLHGFTGLGAKSRGQDEQCAYISK
jgi:hypothetical protein